MGHMAKMQKKVKIEVDMMDLFAIYIGMCLIGRYATGLLGFVIQQRTQNTTKNDYISTQMKNNLLQRLDGSAGCLKDLRCEIGDIIAGSGCDYDNMCSACTQPWGDYKDEVERLTFTGCLLYSLSPILSEAINNIKQSKKEKLVVLADNVITSFKGLIGIVRNIFQDLKTKFGKPVTCPSKTLRTAFRKFSSNASCLIPEEDSIITMDKRRFLVLKEAEVSIVYMKLYIQGISDDNNRHERCTDDEDYYREPKRVLS